MTKRKRQSKSPPPTKLRRSERNTEGRTDAVEREQSPTPQRAPSPSVERRTRSSSRTQVVVEIRKSFCRPQQGAADASNDGTSAPVANSINPDKQRPPDRILTRSATKNATSSAPATDKMSAIIDPVTAAQTKKPRPRPNPYNPDSPPASPDSDSDAGFNIRKGRAYAKKRQDRRAARERGEPYPPAPPPVQALPTAQTVIPTSSPTDFDSSQNSNEERRVNEDDLVSEIRQAKFSSIVAFGGNPLDPAVDAKITRMARQRAKRGYGDEDEDTSDSSTKDNGDGAEDGNSWDDEEPWGGIGAQDLEEDDEEPKAGEGQGADKEDEEGEEENHQQDDEEPWGGINGWYQDADDDKNEGDEGREADKENEKDDQQDGDEEDGEKDGSKDGKEDDKEDDEYDKSDVEQEDEDEKEDGDGEEEEDEEARAEEDQCRDADSVAATESAQANLVETQSGAGGDNLWANVVSAGFDDMSQAQWQHYFDDHEQAPFDPTDESEGDYDYNFNNMSVYRGPEPYMGTPSAIDLLTTYRPPEEDRFIPLPNGYRAPRRPTADIGGDERIARTELERRRALRRDTAPTCRDEGGEGRKRRRDDEDGDNGAATTVGGRTQSQTTSPPVPATKGTRARKSLPKSNLREVIKARMGDVRMTPSESEVTASDYSATQQAVKRRRQQTDRAPSPDSTAGGSSEHTSTSQPPAKKQKTQPEAAKKVNFAAPLPSKATAKSQSKSSAPSSAPPAKSSSASLVGNSSLTSQPKISAPPGPTTKTLPPPPPKSKTAPIGQSHGRPNKVSMAGFAKGRKEIEAIINESKRNNPHLRDETIRENLGVGQTSTKFGDNILNVISEVQGAERRARGDTGDYGNGKAAQIAAATLKEVKEMPEAERAQFIAELYEKRASLLLDTSKMLSASTRMKKAEKLLLSAMQKVHNMGPGDLFSVTLLGYTGDDHRATSASTAITVGDDCKAVLQRYDSKLDEWLKIFSHRLRAVQEERKISTTSRSGLSDKVSKEPSEMAATQAPLVRAQDRVRLSANDTTAGSQPVKKKNAKTSSESRLPTLMESEEAQMHVSGLRENIEMFRTRVPFDSARFSRDLATIEMVKCGSTSLTLAAYRRIVSQTLLYAVAFHRPAGAVVPAIFSYRTFLTTAITHQIRLQNWPSAIESVPGGTFSSQRTSLAHWTMLCESLLQGNLRVEPWSEDERSLEVNSPAYADIPLVRNDKLLVQLRVEHRKIFGKRRKGKGKTTAEAEDEETDEEALMELDDRDTFANVTIVDDEHERPSGQALYRIDDEEPRQTSRLLPAASIYSPETAQYLREVPIPHRGELGGTYGRMLVDTRLSSRSARLNAVEDSSPPSRSRGDSTFPGFRPSTQKSQPSRPAFQPIPPSRFYGATQPQLRRFQDPPMVLQPHGQLLANNVRTRIRTSEPTSHSQRFNMMRVAEQGVAGPSNERFLDEAGRKKQREEFRKDFYGHPDHD